MPTIRWLGPGVFTDNRRGFTAWPDTEHEVTDEQFEEYIDHDQFSHRFEEVEAEVKSEEDEDEFETEEVELDEEEIEVAKESDEICGAVMSDGDICERPADECPYHG